MGRFPYIATFCRTYFIHLIIVSLIFLLGLITLSDFNTSVNDVAIDKNQEANNRWSVNVIFYIPSNILELFLPFRHRLAL